jgi:hypothetical protein
VFRSDTNAPLVDAIIKLADTTKETDDPTYFVASTQTDGDGKYLLDVVKNGTYILGMQMLYEDVT